jgi:hypothetical protein
MCGLRFSLAPPPHRTALVGRAVSPGTSERERALVETQLDRKLPIYILPMDGLETDCEGP